VGTEAWFLTSARSHNLRCWIRQDSIALPLAARFTSSFRCCSDLKAFDDHQFDRLHPPENPQPRSPEPRNSCKQGPTPSGDPTLRCAGRPVHQESFARDFDIETMVGVLDHRNAQSFAKQIGNARGHRVLCAGAAPAREPIPFIRLSPPPWPAHPASMARSNATKQSTLAGFLDCVIRSQ